MRSVTTVNVARVPDRRDSLVVISRVGVVAIGNLTFRTRQRCAPRNSGLLACRNQCLDENGCGLRNPSNHALFSKAIEHSPQTLPTLIVCCSEKDMEVRYS